MHRGLSAQRSVPDAIAALPNKLRANKSTQSMQRIASSAISPNACSEYCQPIMPKYTAMYESERIACPKKSKRQTAAFLLSQRCLNSWTPISGTSGMIPAHITNNTSILNLRNILVCRTERLAAFADNFKRNVFLQCRNMLLYQTAHCCCVHSWSICFENKVLIISIRYFTFKILVV